jgi:selenocysteine lyase/cysteine desulfurase
MDSLSRRRFTRLLALSGPLAAIPPAWWSRAERNEAPARLRQAPIGPAPSATDEAYWRGVRARFLVPASVNFLNAANLCPTSLPAIDALERHSLEYEASPSPQARSGLMAIREEARRLLAAALRVTPEEIVLTRNTTEANNAVSSGLDLKAGDEVVVWADNHPSNLNAWRTKAQRFGFTVVTVPIVARHPGAAGYVELFARAFTSRTRLVAVTHVNSNSGDVLPVAGICAEARRRGILSLVDGAQAFGVLDLDLSAMQPDFYTGSMHKWPCGPKETGLLFASRAVHDRLHPPIVGLYGGAVGLSRTFEANGQRDDAALAAVAESLKFQGAIGRAAIEQRARALAQTLMKELQAIPGVRLWTDPASAHSAAIVIFQPGQADVRQLGPALTAARIVCTTRTGQQNPGVRMSPHFYNTMDEMHAAAAFIRQSMTRQGAKA